MLDKTVFLSLGSNLGDREDNIERAISALEAEQVRVVARAPLYETEPQGMAQQPWFVNTAVQAETQKLPRQLLQTVLRIEKELGRVRKGKERNGPRSIDIDILLFARITMDTPKLTIPHPRLTERRFVLEPLLALNPNLLHPGSKQPLRTYLAATAGQKVRLMR